MGFDRGLTGPGFEREEQVGLLAVFEQRSGLAAGPLSGTGNELDQQLAPVFPASRRRMLTAFGRGRRRGAVPCRWGRWHKLAAVRLRDSIKQGARDQKSAQTQ